MNLKNNLHSTFILIFGVFLFLDGTLSIFFGNACLESCFNNSPIGNIVRIVRTLGGLMLIYLYFHFSKKIKA